MKSAFRSAEVASAMMNGALVGMVASLVMAGIVITQADDHLTDDVF